MKRPLLALVLCVSCNPAPQSAQAPKTSVIVIGQLVDRTGSIATPSWGESIRLAVVHANQALKLSGKAVRFEIAEANSGNSPDMARAGALQLVKQQNAKAIITDSSQDDIAVNMLNYDGDAGHQLDVPIVCMACTSPAIDNPEARDDDPVKQAALRNGKRWNFRTTMSDAYQARMVVHMLLSAGKKGDVNGDGKFKLSIYASDDPYGRGFSDAIRADATRARPGALIEQVFHDVKANPAEYDWAADVAKVTSFLASSGMHVTGVSANRQVVDATGSAMCFFDGGFLSQFIETLQFWYDRGVRLFKFDFAKLLQRLAPRR